MYVYPELIVFNLNNKLFSLVNRPRFQTVLIKHNVLAGQSCSLQINTFVRAHIHTGKSKTIDLGTNKKYCTSRYKNGT